MPPAAPGGEETMGKSIKGSKTEKNVLAAFAGESQARNRYTYFASVAKKEGFEQISRAFTDTAENEKEHAKIFFKLLEGGDTEITAAYPAGTIQDTRANLEAAAAGEKMEWGTLYPAFAKTARDEGYPEIARVFEQVARAESYHESRYRRLAANVEKGEVFKKGAPVRWHCINCGFVYEGKQAPAECPACKHPQAYFEVLAENY
jgi:rubrerythrin